ncbi:hypothetical protein AJ79_01696 [Helicocarpus griseus UAMH5409]|uniref:ELYS-like domain-containing protein n=1 Tax=Helicocarpus griseus UAMH5409 TaxID=1447875 RepID=A0A2B7Y5S7_9EURO|nr:hypothetical protein AJ79_01696 [Helicocarpus griseus UAMH5409]
MAPWEDFDATFSSKRDFTYDSRTYDQIIANRRALENVLFVDRLLKALNIDAASRVYPPKNNQGLRNLYSQIVSSLSPNHHKQALIYYLLRDLRSMGGGDASLQFARRCYLPEKYRLFIEGLWYLDRLEFRRALEYLTEPSLIPTFPDEILYVLAALPKQDDSLATAYYLTASPPLASPKAFNAYFALLCRTRIIESFYFARKQNDILHRELLEQLIVFVLSSKAGEARASRAMDLINLPFNVEEEEWFEECLLSGKAKHLQGAKDTVMMRRVATGQLENLSSDLEALGGRKIEGLNWDDLKKNLRPSSSLAVSETPFSQ